jgi:hypothetical protein
MMSEKGAKPLIPFIQSDTVDCSTYPSCVSAIDAARSYFDPDVDIHIQVVINKLSYYVV